MASAPETPTQSSSRAANNLAGLSIRFVKQGPNEELVHYLRTCASRLKHVGKLEVTIAPHRYGMEVQLQGSASPYAVVETDRDAYLAVRNAFARWAAMLDVERSSTPTVPRPQDHSGPRA